MLGGFGLANGNLIDFEGLGLSSGDPVPDIGIVSFYNAVAAQGSYAFFGGGPMTAQGNTYISHTGVTGSNETVKAIDIYFSTPVTNLQFDVADIDAYLPITIERMTATAFDSSHTFLGSIAIDASMSGTGDGVVTHFDFATLSGIITLELRLDNIGTQPDATAYGWGLDNLQFEVPEPFDIDIDIKPGSYPNSININGNGVIPVAMLGSSDFDVMTIDQNTLSFNGLEVQVRGNKDKTMCHYEDVSGDFTNAEGAPDGYLDLVCHFEDDPSQWEAGEAEATLTGELFDGTPIEGVDTIHIVP